MKILTNKEYERRLECARKDVNFEYKKKALTLDLISNFYGVEDFSSMSIEELKNFFHYNANTKIYDFVRGMKAGINSTIDVFANSGIMRKRTLEKLRFRALKNIDNKTEEYKENDYSS